MQTVDVLIVVFAVVAVVGSIAGAALYEPSEGLQTFGATFSESDEESLAPQQQSSPVSASLSAAEPGFVLPHNITQGGLTQLTFEVMMATDRPIDQRLANPTYEAYLVGPDGQEHRDGDAAATGNFANGETLTLIAPADFVLSAVPEAREIRADNLTMARQQVNQTLLQTNGTGEWEVHVHMTFPQGSAPVNEQVTVSSTPKIRYVQANVGLDIDISPIA